MTAAVGKKSKANTVQGPSEQDAPVRLGLVGAGVFGGYHGWKIHDHPGAKLFGVHDIDGAAARALGDKFGAQCANTIADLFDRVDAVVLTTPAHTHGALALQALEAGIHVFVEKPMALNLDAADAMIEAASARGLVLHVGHQERHVAAALGLLDGALVPHKMISRRCMPATGRGEDVSVVMDLMIHDLDLAACLFDDIATVTVARADLSAAGHAVDAHLQAGAATIELSVSRRSEKRERTLELASTDGAVHVDFLNRTMDASSGLTLGSGFAEYDETDQQPLGLRDPLAFGFEAFMADIAAGTPFSPKAAHRGRRALALAIAVETAAGLRNASARDNANASGDSV